MKDDYVQVNVRMTRVQRHGLRNFSEKEETSMNQFIIDSVFNRINDRSGITDTRENDRKSEEKSMPDDRTLIDILNGQLEKKDEQLDEKDKQIKTMQSLLNQQQQLTLQTNRQIQYLQLEETKETENKLEASEEKEAKKGFFSRWFSS